MELTTSWGKSCGGTSIPELHCSLVARKCQIFEKEEYSGPDAAQGEVLWWPGEHPATPGCTRGEREGRNTQGCASFIIITQENIQFCNNHSGKAGKYSDSVNNSLDMLPIVGFFSFPGLAAAKTFAGCYFAFWGAALSDYLSQPTTASSVFQHDLDGQIFG